MLNQRRLSFITLLPIAGWLFFVSACVKSTPPTPTPVSEATLASEASATTQPGETPVALTLTPADTLSPPTPNPAAFKVGYVNDTSDSLAQPGWAEVQRAAQEFGWTTQIGPHNVSIEVAVRQLISAGAQIIVAHGDTFAAEMSQVVQTVAGEFPLVTFVGVNLTFESAPPANVLALGGASSRFDQLGFLAGMAAGYATDAKSVTAITTLSVDGLNYRNGFLHGVRYTCPRCQLQYIDVFDVDHGGAEAAQTAALYASISSDVVFAAAGQAGNEALKAAAQEGAWVIGSGSDVYVTVFENGVVPGADKTLTSVYFDASAVVYQALVQYHAGAPLTGAQPFSAATQAIALAPYRAVALNTLDQHDLATALARLAEGSLDTGIDPATGQER